MVFDSRAFLSARTSGGGRLKKGRRMIFDNASLEFMREKIIENIGYELDVSLTYDEIYVNDQLLIKAFFHINGDCVYVKSTSTLSIVQSIQEENVGKFLLVEAEYIAEEFKSVVAGNCDEALAG